MKPFTCALAVASLLVIAAPVAHAIPITYTTTLSGASEEPPVTSPGTGTATVIFDTDAHTMRIDTTFSGLVGLTTVAHIHCCTAAPLSGNAPVATQVPSFVDFPVGVSSGSYARDFDLTFEGTWNPAFITSSGGTVATAEAALAAALADGRAYLNIHTDFAPSGEIRGFLVAASSVPTPGVPALFGAALIVLALSRARRRVPAGALGN